MDRVELRREDGSRCFVRARLVVLAAGGIENPRLLLLSRRVHRDGLGNDHDLVGRFFAERMSARTGYIVPASPELIGRAGLYPVHEAAPGVRVQGALRVRDAVQRERQLLNCAFFLLPRNLSMMAEAVRSVATLAKARRRRPLPSRDGSGTWATSPPASGTSAPSLVTACAGLTRRAASWRCASRANRLPTRTPG